jgi:hypothetical protein
MKITRFRKIDFSNWIQKWIPIPRYSPTAVSTQIYFWISTCSLASRHSAHIVHYMDISKPNVANMPLYTITCPLRTSQDLANMPHYTITCPLRTSQDLANMSLYTITCPLRTSQDLANMPHYTITCPLRTSQDLANMPHLHYYLPTKDISRPG